MGNSQPNVILQVVANPKDPDLWRVTENAAYCDLVQHVETGEIAESYTVPLDGRVKLQQEFRKYEYRRTQNENLVKVFQVMKKNSEYLCSGMDFINVKTERIPYRLNQIRNLSLPESLYVLNATLTGYKRIRDLIGPVKIDANMIGITPNGQIRVWLNQNLAKNHPQLEYQFDPQIPDQECQKQMIQYLIQTIRNQLQGQQFPSEISHRLTPDKIKTFQSALQLTRELSQSLGLNINQMKINVHTNPPQSTSQSNISNRQSLPPMPSMLISNIQQSQLSNQPINQIAADISQQIVSNQSQIINQSILQSQIQNNNLQQSQINQLNNSVVQLVRKSSGSLRGSEVIDNSQFVEPIQIIVNGAPQSSKILPSSPVFHVSPLVIDHTSSILPGQISQGSRILQNSQVIEQPPIVTYQQPHIQTIVKGKPPRPISASKNFAPPQIIPYQVVQAVNELRRSRSKQLRRSGSKQLRRSASRQSVETANFVNVTLAQTPISSNKISTNQIGVRAPSPLRNLSGSRVLVGTKVGAPVLLHEINKIQSNQIIQDQIPRVIQYAPTSIQERTVVGLQDRTQNEQRQFIFQNKPPAFIQERVQIERVPIDRTPIINQVGQDRIAVKRSIQKTNSFNNAPITIVNSNNGTNSPVVHLLRHHNRGQEQRPTPINIPINKPMTGDIGRGIGILNQKINTQYRN